MHPSDPILLDMIKHHEGSGRPSLKPYNCPAGKMTIGYGWNIEARGLPQHIRDHLKENGEITVEMADDLLFTSIAESIAACGRIFPDIQSYSGPRQRALVDMCFNLGEKGLLEFRTMRSHIADGDFTKAAHAAMQSKWASQVKDRAKHIYALLRWGV